MFLSGVVADAACQTEQEYPCRIACPPSQCLPSGKEVTVGGRPLSVYPAEEDCIGSLLVILAQFLGTGGGEPQLLSLVQILGIRCVCRSPGLQLLPSFRVQFAAEQADDEVVDVFVGCFHV